SGPAHCSDLLSLMDFLANLHTHSRQMVVRGEQSGAVVNHYRISRRKAAPGEDHLAIVGGEDRRSRSALEIHPEVLTLLRAVEEPKYSKMGSQSTLSRPAEILTEHRRQRWLVVRAIKGCLVLRKPSAFFGGRIDIAIGHAQLAPIEVGLDHRHRA